MTFLIAIMSFANFVFYPLVKEEFDNNKQILRAIGMKMIQSSEKCIYFREAIFVATTWLFNIIVCGYAILLRK